MNNKLKAVAKKILKYNTEFINSDFDVNEIPPALKKFIEENKYVLDKRVILRKRNDGNDFYPAIKEMEPNYNFFNNGVYKYGKSDIKDIFEYDGLQSGTPIRSKAFKPIITSIEKELHSDKLYWYPGPNGNKKQRQLFVDYLKREGFEGVGTKNGLGYENVVFTCSTSHGYIMALNAICKPLDVVLITGPSYGLFATVCELDSAHVAQIDVYEEDDWYVNPSNLAKRIDEINDKLKKEYNGKLNYQPKVAAFLNMNPHNPLGRVMSKKNKEILEGIGDVCLEKGVFVIDDMIYRDLTYDQENLALPMASYKKYFNNTISLFGISKAFGTASLRAGVLIAPVPVVRKIENDIEHQMLAFPILQSAAVVGAFNASNKRYKDLREYLDPLIEEYQYRFQMLKAMVEGIESIKDIKTKSKIIKDINRYESDSKTVEILLDGIPDVEIRKGTEPDSGFFAVLDFTKLKGKKIDDITINQDKDLLRYLYQEGKIKFIMGSNIMWPYKNEIVGRVTFSLDKDALINNMKIINKSIRKLK